MADGGPAWLSVLSRPVADQIDEITSVLLSQHSSRFWRSLTGWPKTWLSRSTLSIARFNNDRRAGVAIFRLEEVFPVNERICETLVLGLSTVIGRPAIFLAILAICPRNSVFSAGSSPCTQASCNCSAAAGQLRIYGNTEDVVEISFPKILRVAKLIDNEPKPVAFKPAFSTRRLPS